MVVVQSSSLWRTMPRLLTLGRKRMRSSLSSSSSLKFLSPHEHEGVGQRTVGANRSKILSASVRRNLSSHRNNGSSMRIYDSLSSTYRTFPHPQNQNSHDKNKSAPQSLLNKNDKSYARGTAWYVCGPTVYDSAHLGHGRTYVALDILRRVALNLHAGSGSIGASANDKNDAPIITPRPLYVMNITDVDDKIIQRSQTILSSAAQSEGKEQDADPIKLARIYENEFWQDMDSLNVLRPDVICRVSEHVEMTIVPYIEKIIQGGMAYVIPESDGSINGDDTDQGNQGSVYFDVRAFESVAGGRTKYGKLAPDSASTDFFSWDNDNPNNSNEGEEGEKGSTVRRKRDPRDFCLWKSRPRASPSTDPDIIIEPESVSYSSPWGPGRPGWHVECSAMIARLAHDFRSTHEFGVHCGGVDLKFPHHSNEIAQSEAYNLANNAAADGGKESLEEWIPHWVHTGHLHVKGRKMSKSLKNFVTIREMLGTSTGDNDTTISVEADHGNNAWHSPTDDFRLWVLGLSGHYRGPATYSQDRMEEARVLREKWIKFLMEGQECLERLKSKSSHIHHQSKDEDVSSRLWGEEELGLFNAATACGIKCRRALLNDLDGTSFAKELNGLTEFGMAYVEKSKRDGQNNNNMPEEPLRFVLDTFRGQLDLVGFTSKTVHAGITSTAATQGGEGASTSSSPINTAAVLDEAIVFRAEVRSAAINAIRNKKKDGDGASVFDAVKEILKLCDGMRNDTFPQLGVEILDGKVIAAEGNENGDANRGWRYCSPRDSKKTNKKS